MQKVMSYFRQICEIPHLSYETEKLRDFLVEFAKKHEFSVEVDSAGNIYAIKGEPQICLQAHYDMVGVGLAPQIELVEQDGFLSAKNSSLGADNGIGVAIIMAMMSEFSDFEAVFTNNEEVGLWGVREFNAEIKSKKMLNLDSEDENEVIIGCAGSAEIRAICDSAREKKSGFCYEIFIDDFPGGHSGIEIHKNLPNGVKFLAEFVAKNGGKIAEFSGGERANSIPAKASVTAIFKNEISNFPNFIKHKFLGFKECEIYENSDNILNLICEFKQGVRDFNDELKLPQTSINLSLAGEKNGKFELLFYARSMSEKGLKGVKYQTKMSAENFGLECVFGETSQPWQPQISEFSEFILKNLQKFVPTAKLSAVHAGLECGVFITKDSAIQAASIGPNITSPHSTHEKVELKSVEKILNAVREIMTNTQNL
ncbi:M20/M25/M40 family metallo-hydrolase [Campylobacter sp. JMF_01 NE2]|uniref:M28 family peptidase n=1 Tax=unclassified Campylobacter TaxID=2593542 RepID=UPI0022E9F90E|nr:MULTISPECIES: M28 family peptidase [unclassified Campylobacter]MDA3052631.1 M20/M25/M40 family metallo-hydrolase [Campylobacter sp. JMF_03 NE3]MDA3066962.1 M20/M25/M40 family metallo-hydrolase [Campylobacter sp. JMF_01 NE2]